MDVHPLRKINRSRLLRELAYSDLKQQPALANRLGLSLMAVTRIAHELAEVGLLTRDEPTGRADHPGRPAANLTIRAEGAFVVGVELHAYAQSLAIMDLAQQVVHREAIDLDRPEDGAASIQQVARQIVGMVKRSGIDPLRVLAVGAAITGVVDRKSGRLIESPYLGWKSVDVSTAIHRHIRRPIVVDRIANALLASETGLSANPLKDAILFNVGFGISASLLVDGEMARGKSLNAGQIGHMDSGQSGVPCPCGKVCMNTIASGWAVLAELGKTRSTRFPAKHLRQHRASLLEVLRQDQAGEPAASAALTLVGERFGRGIRNLVEALNSERVILSGPVGRSSSFLKGTKAGLAKGHVPVQNTHRQVDEAAARLALHEFVLSHRLNLELLPKSGESRTG